MDQNIFNRIYLAAAAGNPYAQLQARRLVGGITAGYMTGYGLDGYGVGAFGMGGDLPWPGGVGIGLLAGAGKDMGRKMAIARRTAAEGGDSE